MILARVLRPSKLKLEKKPVRSCKQQKFRIIEPYKNHFRNLKSVKGFNDLSKPSGDFCRNSKKNLILKSA